MYFFKLKNLETSINTTVINEDNFFEISAWRSSHNAHKTSQQS